MQHTDVITVSIIGRSLSIIGEIPKSILGKILSIIDGGLLKVIGPAWCFHGFLLEASYRVCIGLRNCIH